MPQLELIQRPRGSHDDYLVEARSGRVELCLGDAASSRFVGRRRSDVGGRLADLLERDS